MAKRDIVVSILTKVQGKDLKDLEKNLDSVGKKTESTGGIFQKLGSRLSMFGDNVGKDLTGKMGAAGQAADNLGVGMQGMSGAMGAAAAGVVAFGGFVASGVGKLKELYDQTRDFNEVAGTTWEEGSRLIAVFDDLRVSSDEGASAMQRLARTVGTSPEVLQEYGIEVAKAKDGTVDMTGTLANVATAFQKTTDPTRRAALGNALFGKSWQNMVPVLNQGGKSLRALIDNVDEGQVATEAGAEAQDKLFEATDNLNDALDAMARQLAENVLPALTEVISFTTKLIEVSDNVGHVIGEVSRLGGVGKDILHAADDMVHFGNASDHVGKAVDGVASSSKLAGPAIDIMAAGLKNVNPELATTKQRAGDAKKAYDEFKKKVDDLLKQQEDMRNAQLDSEDSALAYERAQIAAGDASQDLSVKADTAEKALSDFGAESDTTRIAQEEYRRSLVDAKGAMLDSANAAMTNAEKIAETHGVTLTAAEKVAVFRDELIRLRSGAQDPGLQASLDELIQKYADLAAQAQNAAANLKGLHDEMYQQAGLERNYTTRDSSGAAVVRRATGGPVWPGRTYLVGEHGPELLNLPKGSGPGDVLSAPQSVQEGTGWPLLSGGGGAYPTITTNADGTVMFGGDPNTYPGSSVITAPAPKFPTVNTSVRRTTPSIPGYGPSSSSGGASGAGTTIYITVNGYADIKKLVEAIKAYERSKQ